MVYKSIRYTFVKAGVYYFNRRVPQDVRQAYLTQRISFSLKTKSPAQAYKAASHVIQKLEAHWLNVRLAKDQLGLGRYLKGPYKAKSGGSATVMDITFNNALEIYLLLKSRNKGHTFFKDTRRAVRYLIDSVWFSHIRMMLDVLASALVPVLDRLTLAEIEWCCELN